MDRYEDGDDNGNVLGLCWPGGAVIRGRVSLIIWGSDPLPLACGTAATLVLFPSNMDTQVQPCLPTPGDRSIIPPCSCWISCYSYCSYIVLTQKD